MILSPIQTRMSKTIESSLPIRNACKLEHFWGKSHEMSEWKEEEEVNERRMGLFSTNYTRDRNVNTRALFVLSAYGRQQQQTPFGQSVLQQAIGRSMSKEM